MTEKILNSYSNVKFESSTDNFSKYISKRNVLLVHYIYNCNFLQFSSYLPNSKKTKNALLTKKSKYNWAFFSKHSWHFRSSKWFIWALIRDEWIDFWPKFISWTNPVVKTCELVRGWVWYEKNRLKIFQTGHDYRWTSDNCAGLPKYPGARR